MATGFPGRVKAGGDGGDLSPGEHLRAEIERLGLDQVSVSQATGVSRQSINNIVNGRQPISRAMAGKLGRLTGHSSDYWLRASFAPASHAGIPGLAEGDPGAAMRPMGVGVLVNHQIVRAVKDGILMIEPFAERNVRAASVDLTLDDFIVTAAGKEIDVSGGQPYFLESGGAVTVGTREWLELPHDYIGRAGTPAALAADGIMASQCFQIAPGFTGNLRFCVLNAGPRDFALRSGQPIIGIEIIPLCATPAPDRHPPPAIEPARHERLGFGRGACARLVRDAVRARAHVEIGDDGAKARIAELNIEIIDATADAALDSAVHSALGGLATLREKPQAAREDRERYARFFGAVAERLYLTSEQARCAARALGLPADGADTIIATLRDGSEAVVTLPANAARISLRQLARQVREDPLDLLLVVAGVPGERPSAWRS